jgi:hypothetical protein
MAEMSHAKIRINRAPGLPLRTAIVTERLGFGRATALTLGQAVAGLSAPASSPKSPVWWREIAHLGASVHPWWNSRRGRLAAEGEPSAPRAKAVSTRPVSHRFGLARHLLGRTGEAWSRSSVDTVERHGLPMHPMLRFVPLRG